MQNFRADYKADWKMRVLDFVLHLVAAFLITRVLMHYPWRWILWQWFPDMYLLVIWPYSMITSKYLADNNWALIGHQGMHSWQAVILALCIVLFLSFGSGHWNLPLMFSCFGNCFVHIGIDHFTHEKVKA